MRSNRSSGWRIAVVGSALAALVAAIHVTKDKPQSTYYAAKGYVARANSLIRNELIYYDCVRKRIEDRIDKLDPADPDRRWFERSQLRADIGEFNRAPDASGRYFIVDSTCRLREIRPSIRNVRLPFSEAVEWMGAIRYSGSGGGAALRSRSRTLTLVDPHDRIRAQHEAMIALGSSQSRTIGSALLHFPGAQSVRGAEIHFVGTDVVLRRKDGGDVRLLGYRVPNGRNMKLSSGDWIDFAQPDGEVVETFQFLSDAPNLEASSVLVRNDRHERRFDPEIDLGTLLDPRGGVSSPLLANLIRDVSDGLSRLGPASASLQRGFDLQLPIVRGLQVRVSQILREHLENWTTAQRSPSGGVTVLNGQTGEILALATYPNVADLKGHEGLDGLERSRLLANQNFRLHPIGSAMKPFMFAAIANAFPFLRQLVVGAHGHGGKDERQYSSLQCHFGHTRKAGYHLCTHAAPVDFETALEVSCNRYTVDLAMLALAAQSSPVPGERGLKQYLLADPTRVRLPRDWPGDIRINDEKLSFAPDLGNFVVGTAGPNARTSCQQVTRLEELPYLRGLSDLTGAATYSGEEPAGIEKGDLYEHYRSALYDIGLLSPLVDFLERAGPADVEVRPAFHGGWPEAVNFAFNDIGQLRGGYVSFALGGASASWTNVQLAEALSRLVSGRRVQSRFVDVVDLRTKEKSATASSEPADIPEIALDAGVRSAVLRGMARVTEGDGGTAHALKAPVHRLAATFPDHDVFVFAKTGTPTFVSSHESPNGTVLRKLVQGSWLRLENDTLVVSSGPLSIPYAARPGRQRTEFMRALREVTQALSSEDHADFVLRAADEFAEHWLLRVAQPGQLPDATGALTLAKGRLEINPDADVYQISEKPRTGRVFIMALVAVPKRPGGRPEGVPTVAEVADPRSRVLTAVMHLDVVSKGHAAVRLAEDLLPELAMQLREMLPPTPAGVRHSSNAH